MAAIKLLFALLFAHNVEPLSSAHFLLFALAHTGDLTSARPLCLCVDCSCIQVAMLYLVVSLAFPCLVELLKYCAKVRGFGALT